MIFYLTFGQQSPMRDGWIEIHAEDYATARELAFTKFGQAWAFVYSEDDFDKSFFPAGKLGEITTPFYS